MLPLEQHGVEMCRLAASMRRRIAPKLSVMTGAGSSGGANKAATGLILGHVDDEPVGHL